MGVYAFAKRGVSGGAYIMTGDSIRDAMQNVQERRGCRPHMGTVALPKDLGVCVLTLLTADERAGLARFGVADNHQEGQDDDE